jgi:hypothetical protein
MAATLSEHINTDLQPRSAAKRAGVTARFEQMTNRSRSHDVDHRQAAPRKSSARRSEDPFELPRRTTRIEGQADPDKRRVKHVETRDAYPPK